MYKGATSRRALGSREPLLLQPTLPLLAEAEVSTPRTEDGSVNWEAGALENESHIAGVLVIEQVRQVLFVR